MIALAVNLINFLKGPKQFNPDFIPIEFERFKSQAGLNRFTLLHKKWIDATDAIGLVSKAGRYGGGTYAHKDVAFEYGSWLSPEFKLYLIKKFQRLKEEEYRTQSLERGLQRTFVRINYKIHPDTGVGSLKRLVGRGKTYNCWERHDCLMIYTVSLDFAAEDWGPR